MKIQAKVDLGVYPLESVQAAAYTFSREAYVKISRSAGKTVQVELDSKDGKLQAGRDLLGEFYNELLHHSLRLKISANNQMLREKIVAQALLSVQPQAAGQEQPQQQAQPVLDEELEKEIEKLLKEAGEESYKDDALGIAVPWEKSKNAKKSKRKN